MSTISPESRGEQTPPSPHTTPRRGPRSIGQSHGQHTHTLPRGPTRGCSRAASSLTQDGEAPENLSVIFNSQGDRWICRSTNLLEKQPRSGTLPGTGTGRLQTHRIRPSPEEAALGLGTGAVLGFGTGKAPGWRAGASHNTDVQSGAFGLVLAQQSSACGEAISGRSLGKEVPARELRHLPCLNRLHHLDGTTGLLQNLFPTSQPFRVLPE